MTFLILSQLLNGFALGMIYALVGVGLTLILGILNIPNFAHGALYAIGAYLTYTVARLTGSFYIAILIAPLGTVLIGLVLEHQGIRRLYSAHHDYQLLFLFAMALILQELIVIIWGPVGFSVMPPKALMGATNLGFVIYPTYRLALIVFTLIIIVTLTVFLTFTNLGAILRAGIEDREMASVLGINIDKMFLLTFGLGAWLAGLAGALATPILGLTPTMGLDILPISFVIVVVAGLGSVPGAIVAGILIGIAQGLTTIWWPQAANVVIYILMGLTIIARPQGLFGTR
ncbi:branched-chain amino acid ABC transporter permease [Acuticoccus sediminis]|uniref:Branched-chain amino acid ABC transporter permease n=1 Tax=Acuticoccus sediminis TaxID=2184697 RepID=A0A8B2NQ55_9HYPH|nr:branched-chain amino acid ABC transporter permease [Acuticoccus sediminis]RAI02016.1 branched-chain amino acid ABC transporter permease [Acuticoccus sediminis]